MGSAYFKFSVRFLRELENEEHFIKRLQRESEGALKISAPKSFGSFLFADAVAEFASLHPDINVSLTLDDSSSLQTKSIEYEFDVAIRLMAIEDSTAVARKIGGIDWIACASADYILRHGAPQHPQDLTKANCLVHPKLASDNLWRFVSGNRIVAVKVGGTFASNSVVVLRRAALRGLGIALLPLYRVQRDLASGELVQVLKDYPLQERPFYVLLPDNRLMPEKVRLFIDFLARWYRQNGESFRLADGDALSNHGIEASHA